MSKTQSADDKQLLSKLAKDFHDLVSNRETLRTSVEDFLNTVIDELTLGIIFDLHRKYKTNAYEIDMDDEDADDDDAPEADIFTQHDLKKTQECVCPNCDRAVAASRFAPHLETCMGMGRSRSRNSTRRVTTSNSKDRENSSFSGVPSDDEDDIDWNSGNKRGKKKKRNNGNKKSKGTPKKGGDAKSSETANVEVDGEEDELSNLRDLLQDHSNSSSPADSVSSNQSNSSKKKEKVKNKKSKRDRSSPSSSISAE